MASAAESIVTTRAESAALLAWFDTHKRDLPWRRSRDPYAIWVSEIMLQQTRVAAVLEHYARWMARFPTVGALAAAEEPEVLALWSGLGYYRRARFLHAGARAVIAEHNGRLPRTAASLRRLPGIGEYTSAAIASIAFEEPVAVVDGNVERVVMRLAGLAAGAPPAAESSAKGTVGSGTPLRVLPAAALAREIRVIANELLDEQRPGDFNQAMMELGATVCLPRAPLCLSCPVQPWCVTRGEHVGAPRKAMQSRSVSYVLATREGAGDRKVLLTQRGAEDSLMAGMWELPPMPATADGPGEARAVGAIGVEPQTLLTLRHAITVTNYSVSIVAATDAQVEALCLDERVRWAPLATLPGIALTGLARKVLRRLSLWPEMVAV